MKQKSIIENAKNLRKNITDLEYKLWKILKNRNFKGFKFRRQHPIGRYIVDFVCLEARLIIEIDGLHHQEQYNYDENRSNDLEKMGFTILRFWNKELINDFEKVKMAIYNQLKSNNQSLMTPHPPLSPAGRGNDRVTHLCKHRRPECPKPWKYTRRSFLKKEGSLFQTLTSTPMINP